MNPSIPRILPGAEPFFFHGGAAGCLCLHGLSASPAEVRWLGVALAERGFTIYGPRLTGHGIHQRDLRHIRWQDWYTSALDGLHMLRGICDEVYVTGLSMGGILALLLAAENPDSVNGIAPLAAPLILPNSRILRLARWIKFVRPFLHLPDVTDFPERLKAEQTRRGEPAIGRVRYDTWPTNALYQLQTLMDITGARLDAIKAPALLVYSEADQTVPFDNLAHLQAALTNAKTVETFTVADSDHILVQDQRYREVLARVGDFFAAQSAVLSG